MSRFDFSKQTAAQPNLGVYYELLEDVETLG